MTVTDEIKSRLDIVDVISDSVQLRKSGSSYTGFCPFHPNTRTPAFVVFPNTQSWRCFGACAEGGDLFSFVMKKEGWDFKETLTQLAKRAGVELTLADPQDKVQRAVEDKLADLLEGVADYYSQLLLFAPQAEYARQYVSERGLSDETISTFKVGYALDSWDACRNHFSMQGYSDEDLEDAGLLTLNEEKGTRYDRFRNRLMIPIRDVKGRIAGFGARTLDPDGLPKYLNSPQTAVFDKSRLLFGLDLARRHIRSERQVVIVEGYMDVMQAWQAGYLNVVAQMGTALTEAQLRLLKRFTKRFVLALDADAAGGQATLRSLEVAREVLDRGADVRFNARGLIRHEGRLQADIRIVTLPEGTDPDKIIRTDPELWPQLIEQAKPVVEYVIDVAVENLDMGDAKAKAAVAEQVLPLIDDVNNPVEREHYRQLLARQLQVDERILLKIALPSKPRRSAPAQAQGKKSAAENQGQDMESKGLVVAISGSSWASDMRRADFLRQCLAYPQVVNLVDNHLAQNQQPVVTEADFTRLDDRFLWRQMKGRQSQRPIAAIDDLWDSSEDEFLRERVKNLLNLPDTEESEFDRLPGRLVLSVLDWRLERIKSLISEVELLSRETHAQDSHEMHEMYHQQLRDLSLQMLSINRARGAMSATGRRQTGIQGNLRRKPLGAD